ncbi:unnamed protein product [Allacma fusca]|uniref:Uncharacterized protein n=1 Tax=Allacma fusca TaxID=39272 RepID=A0A8J2PSA7_9HEXA|nr:unnamed protein product [Allacma fusca]
MRSSFYFLAGLLFIFGEAFANPIQGSDESFLSPGSRSSVRQPREVLEATTLSGILNEPEPEPESEPEPRSEPEPEPESEPEPAANDYISLENSDESQIKQQSKDPEALKAANSALDSIMTNLKARADEG